MRQRDKETGRTGDEGTLRLVRLSGGGCMRLITKIAVLFFLTFQYGAAQCKEYIDKTRITADSSYLDDLVTYAIMDRNIDVLRQLLDMGKDLYTNNHQTPGVCAYSTNDKELARRIISSNKIGLKNAYDYLQTMKQAVFENDLEMIKFMFQNGYPLHKKSPSRKMDKDTVKILSVYREGSPLAFITDKNKPELFDSILALGENIDGNDPLTESPLLLAIQRRDYKYAIRLLEHGARGDVENCCDGTKALDYLKYDMERVQWIFQKMVADTGR